MSTKIAVLLGRGERRRIEAPHLAARAPGQTLGTRICSRHWQRPPGRRIRPAMNTLILVATGGATGAVMRYLLGQQALRTFGGGWPYGTLVANVLGGLLMGALAAALTLRGGPDQEKWRLLLGVGVLGGFTTFSAYSFEIAMMIERRAFLQAATYSLGSIVLSVAGLFAGLILVRRLLA